MEREKLIEMAAYHAFAVVDNGIHHYYVTGIGHDARKRKKAKRRMSNKSRRNNK